MVAVFQVAVNINAKSFCQGGQRVMKKALLIVLLVLMVGCSKKQTMVPEGASTPEDKVTQEEVATGGIEEEVVEEIIVAREDEKAGESMKAAEEEAKEIFRDIPFDFDKYDIRPEARPILDNVANFLYKNKRFNVVIEGHCDERGTNEYNLALGEKRAKSAQSYLSSLGVQPSRIVIMTYGEEKPLCTEADEYCWQKNRRAHFVLVK
jgi:peptidoglycan-associated lipoprotein